MNRCMLALVIGFLICAHPLFSESVEAEPRIPSYAKAKSLIIPEIIFEKISLQEAVKFFQEQSEALDPEKKGLNIILKKPEKAPAVEPTLTLNLKKVPLSDVLRYVSSLTNYQIKYEEHAVILIPPDPVKNP